MDSIQHSEMFVEDLLLCAWGTVLGAMETSPSSRFPSRAKDCQQIKIKYNVTLG